MDLAIMKTLEADRNAGDVNTNAETVKNYANGWYARLDTSVRREGCNSLMGPSVRGTPGQDKKVSTYA